MLQLDEWEIDKLRENPEMIRYLIEMYDIESSMINAWVDPPMKFPCDRAMELFVYGRTLIERDGVDVFHQELIDFFGFNPNLSYQNVYVREFNTSDKYL